MADKNLVVVLVVFCIAIVQVTAQPCSPAAVENVTVTFDSILSWAPASGDSCATNYYLLYITNETHTVFTYLVSSTRLSLTFLPVCESYLFTIIPVSNDNLEGGETQLYAKMPFPLDADLHIEQFGAATREGAVYLEWRVATAWEQCADRYRLTVYDVESDTPVDFYVSNTNITLSGLVPCTQYTFGIRAIYNLESEGPYASTRYPAPPARLATPTLIQLTLGSTTVDLTWQLQSYLQNRCAVTTLVIDASPYFTIAYPVLDQTNRPPLSIRLTNLAPDTMYVLNVTILNTAGATEPSVIGVQTLLN